MRLALQTVLYWCIFTTVLLLVKGAKEDFNSSLKNRFRVWLQSRVRRDLGSEGHADTPAAPQQRGDTNHDPQLPSSLGLNTRSRRSPSAKKTTCRLPTCIFPDLIKRLNEYTQEKDNAPIEKVGCKGYGRRRRALLGPRGGLTLRTGRPSSRRSDGTSRGGHHATPPTLD